MRKLDRRNFRKRILAMNVLAEAGRQESVPHRAATLYRFDKRAYDKAVETASTSSCEWNTIMINEMMKARATLDDSGHILSYARLEDNPITDSDSYKSGHCWQYVPGMREHDLVLLLARWPLPQHALQRPSADDAAVPGRADHDEPRAGGCGAIESHGDPFNRQDWEHIVTRYDGRLPLRICAVPEGTVVPTGNVLYTVQCTTDNPGSRGCRTGSRRRTCASGTRRPSPREASSSRRSASKPPSTRPTIRSPGSSTPSTASAAVAAPAWRRSRSAARPTSSTSGAPTRWRPSARPALLRRRRPIGKRPGGRALDGDLLGS